MQPGSSGLYGMRHSPIPLLLGLAANMNIAGNNFESVDKKLCKKAVMEGGEMVEFRADCNICRCESLCHTCVGGE